MTDINNLISKIQFLNEKLFILKKIQLKEEALDEIKFEITLNSDEYYEEENKKQRDLYYQEKIENILFMMDANNFGVECLFKENLVDRNKIVIFDMIDKSLSEIHSDLLVNNIIDEDKSGFFKNNIVKMKLNNKKRMYNKVTIFSGISSFIILMFSLIVWSEFFYNIFIFDLIVFLCLICHKENLKEFIIRDLNETVLKDNKSLYVLYDESVNDLIKKIKENKKYSEQIKKTLVDYFIHKINTDKYHVYLEKIIFKSIKKIEEIHVYKVSHKKIIEK